MNQTSQKKLPLVHGGDNILINIAGVYHRQLDPRYVLAIVMEEVEPHLFLIE